MLLNKNPAISKKIIEELESEYRIEKPLPHLTELVYCLTRSYYDRISPLPPTEREILLFALGFGLERLLLKQQRKSVAGKVEGIHYSPDFLAFTDVPGELKTTRSSSIRFAEEFFPETWKRQILGYMHCLGVNKYELVVLFICGNYKPPFPELVSYRISADPDEVENNWQWLQMRKEIYLACINDRIVPTPRMFCDEWECKLCRYAIRCEAEVKQQ